MSGASGAVLRCLPLMLGATFGHAALRAAASEYKAGAAQGVDFRCAAGTSQGMLLHAPKLETSMAECCTCLCPDTALFYGHQGVCCSLPSCNIVNSSCRGALSFVFAATLVAQEPICWTKAPCRGFFPMQESQLGLHVCADDGSIAGSCGAGEAMASGRAGILGGSRRSCGWRLWRQAPVQQARWQTTSGARWHWPGSPSASGMAL